MPCDAEPDGFDEVLNSLFETGQVVLLAVAVAEDAGPPAVARLLVRPREISAETLKVLDRIGGSNFGDVHAGLPNERAVNGTPAYRVAAKTAKPDVDGSANRKDLSRRHR